MATRAKNRRKDEGCCGIVFLKYIVSVFNVIFWFSGIAFMALGIYILVMKHEYVSLLGQGTYVATTYILIAAGAIVFLVGIVGCIGVFKDNRVCLVIYALCLIVIFLLEAISGVLAYMYEGTIKEDLTRNMKTNMLENYKYDLGVTQAVDEMNQNFHCCGAVGYEDWAESKWLKRNNDTKNKTPESCCISPGPVCAKRVHPSNIRHRGCMEYLESFVRENLIIIGGVGLGLCSLQIFGIIFSCCLVRKIKQHEEDE